jgi:hypothetical protein
MVSGVWVMHSHGCVHEGYSDISTMILGHDFLLCSSYKHYTYTCNAWTFKPSVACSNIDIRLTVIDVQIADCGQAALAPS